MTRMAFSVLCVLLVSCSGSSRLSDDARSKLDPAVQRLLTGQRVIESEYDTSLRPDGTKEYGLVVRTANPDALKKADIRVLSVFGDVVTVRVTLDELKKLVDLPSVRSVANSSKNYPQ